jgi:hypothetical protein
MIRCMKPLLVKEPHALVFKKVKEAVFQLENMEDVRR